MVSSGRRHRRHSASSAAVWCGGCVGLVFSGPMAYVVWRNVDLGTDLTDVIWSRISARSAAAIAVAGLTVSLSAAFIGTGWPG